jgi:hypothetical protein
LAFYPLPGKKNRKNPKTIMLVTCRKEEKDKTLISSPEKKTHDLKIGTTVWLFVFIRSSGELPDFSYRPSLVVGPQLL